jgi:hypothetical protein
MPSVTEMQRSGAADTNGSSARTDARKVLPLTVAGQRRNTGVKNLSQRDSKVALSDQFRRIQAQSTAPPDRMVRGCGLYGGCRRSAVFAGRDSPGPVWIAGVTGLLGLLGGDAVGAGGGGAGALGVGGFDGEAVGAFGEGEGELGGGGGCGFGGGVEDFVAGGGDV